MKVRMTRTLAVAAVMGCGALGAFGADAFATACSNAWIKGVTRKSPVAYAVNEDMVFTLSLQGVTNAPPEGAYRFRWKRTGDDGVTAEGFAPVGKMPFTYTTRSGKPGGVRLTVDVVGKDGKPIEGGSAKARTPICFTGGALAGASRIEPPAEPAGFATRLKDLVKRLGKPNLKKIDRTPVTLGGLHDVTLSSVELPAAGDRPVKCLLAMPKAASETAPYPARLNFVSTPAGKDIPLPKPQNVKATEIVVTLAYDPGKPEARDEAFCTALFLDVGRALQYLKSLPEWDGKTILSDGWGMGGLLAIWAAGSGEGVTGVSCGLVPQHGFGSFDPVNFARHIDESCRIDIVRAGLGDASVKPAEIAAFWNALRCDRRMTWMQGSEGWTVPRGYKERDTVWEKIRPVRFLHMDAEHAKVETGIPRPFADPEARFRDKIVLEIVFDYSNPSAFDPTPLTHMQQYITKALLPFEMYAVVPEKKVRDKPWQAFRARLNKLGMKNLPFPIYLNAGIDVPVSGPLPCFRIVGHDGVLRYSGNDANALMGVCQRLAREMPPFDPLFAYTKPDLLKEAVDRFIEAKLPPSKIYKAIEAEGKKAVRKDQAVVDEARHLLSGMHQAVDRRVKEIAVLFNERPGLGYCKLQDLVAEWPDRASSPGVAGLMARAGKNPEIEKLAKLEKELAALHAWQPEKPMEIKKKDARIEVFRKNLEKLAKSKSATVQGEALLIQTDLDNPPAKATDGE